MSSYQKSKKIQNLVYNITDTPDKLQDPVQHFAQIGPPRNVTVVQTQAGDEFVVSWYPPEYGIDSLKLYVVRWYREPGHILHGSAETRENYYIGESCSDVFPI